MAIVLDCPQCKKRYEVSNALAGKKSRCKQCGEVFRIPVPTVSPTSPVAKSAPSRPVDPPPGAGEWDSVLVKPPSKAIRSFDSAGSRPQAGSPASAARKIVLNCPNCGKRYEVDASLAGKKSRCKDCRKVFSIPVPTGRANDSPAVQRPAPVATAKPPSPANWNSLLEEEPSAFKASRGPAAPEFDDSNLPPPPRATYPKPVFQSSRRRNSGNNPDLGVTIAGFYILLVIVVGVVFWVWKEAAEPTNERIGAIFALTTGFVHGTAVVLSFAGSIWVLVLAFQEKAQQGVLCLLVPCYHLYYVMTRWEDTRGAFTLQMLPVVNVVVAAAAAFSIGYVRGYERSAASTASAQASQLTANRFKVEEAEQTFREYIKSIDSVTNQFAVIQRPGYESGSRQNAITSVNIAKMMENRVRHVTLDKNEWIAVKHRLGDKLRSSLTALKREMARLEALPGLRGIFRDGPELIEKEIAFWALKPGEEVEPVLVDGPAMPLGPMLVPGAAPPGFGAREATQSPWAANSRSRGPADPNYQFQKFNAAHGERAVTIMFSGIPANADPSRGVTARDVSEAVGKRTRALVPGATNFHWMSRGNKPALLLAPVDDVAGLANAIDFGTATVEGKQINVVISADFLASVPRLPAEEQRAAVIDPGRLPRNSEPEIPANADAVVKSLIQLKSPEVHRKKEALNRLERTPPDERAAEVVKAILPLLEDDDGWLVGDAIKVLGVWKSAEAVPALISRTADNRGSVRHEAIKSLAKIKDPRGVEPIVARIKEDGFQAEDALKEMGPMAEQTLIERLTNPDSGVRRRVCEILKAIGGKETLKAMQALPADPDFGVRMAAKDTMSSIVLRVGPLSPAERKSKSASGRGSRP